MREDLAKCTTEQERAGARGKCFKTKYGGKVKIHPDLDHDYQNEFGGFRSSARHRHFNHKSFTDRLGALKGNLRVNLGRPWDAVYSEFSKRLDRRGVSGHHIWQHLMWEVSTKTFMHNGIVYEASGGVPYPVRGFYVHPETGLLCYEQNGIGWWHRPRCPKEVDLVVPGDEAWTYKQFDGLWFRYRVIEKGNSYGPFKSPDIIERRSANKREIRWIKEQIAAVARKD